MCPLCYPTSPAAFSNCPLQGHPSQHKPTWANSSGEAELLQDDQGKDGLTISGSIEKNTWMWHLGDIMVGLTVWG